MVNTLEDIVRKLDVQRAQVLVEAAIVEISGDISHALGVRWAGTAGKNSVEAINFTNTGLALSNFLAEKKRSCLTAPSLD